MLRIHHVNPKTNFSIVPNEITYNEQLSVLARHVLRDLIGRPPGWQTTADRMWQQARKARGNRAEGRRAWREAWNELEEAGYLVRRRVRVGSAWEMHADVYSTPQNPAGSAPPEENPADPAPSPPLGSTGFGTPETGTSLVSTETPSTESSSADAGSTLRVDRESSSVLTDGLTASSERHMKNPMNIPYQRVRGRAKHTPWADFAAALRQGKIDIEDAGEAVEALLPGGFAPGQENMAMNMLDDGYNPKAVYYAALKGGGSVE